MGKRSASATGKFLPGSKSQGSPTSATSTGVKTSASGPLSPASSEASVSASLESSTTPVTQHTPAVSKQSTHKNHHQNFHYAVIYSLVLIGFVYIALFKGVLIEDPVFAMTQTIPVVIMIQLWYCMSGGLDAELIQVYLKRVNKDSSNTSSTGKKRKVDMSIASSFSTALLATILSVIMSVLVFGLLILFGAPASTYIHQTFLCAVHISILSVQPLVYVYNLDSNTWKDIISAKLPLNGVYGASVGAWVGAWLGAIPIPLDWDRPWQQWPITILTGCYIGTAVGTIVGASYRKFRKSKQGQ